MKVWSYDPETDRMDYYNDGRELKGSGICERQQKRQEQPHTSDAGFNKSAYRKGVKAVRKCDLALERAWDKYGL